MWHKVIETNFQNVETSPTYMNSTVGVPDVMAVMGLFTVITGIPCVLQLSTDQQERVLETCNCIIMKCHSCKPK